MMPSNSRVSKAFSATRALGIPDEEVKPVLKELLKVFDKNWEPIEEENYRALLDAYFERNESKRDDKEEKGVLRSNGFGRQSKRLLLEGEDEISCTLDNSSQKLAQEEDVMRPSTLEQGSLKKIRQSLRDTIDSSSKPPQARLIHQGMDKGKDPLSNNVVPRDRKSSGEKATCAMEFKQPMKKCCSTQIQRIKPSNHHKKDLIKRKNDRTVGDLEQLPHAISVVHPVSSAPEVVPFNCDARSTSGTSNRAFSIADSERNSNIEGSSRHNLVVVKKRPIIPEKRLINLLDITKGTELVKISLVHEIGNGQLPEFIYIPHNIIYQNAYVHISMARIADEDCCLSCSGDCLSSSLPCECTRETGGEFAYNSKGLLKEEFLRACITTGEQSEKHPVVYCQQGCPIERSKNEYFPEPCKGHIVRKFIKECWRKCGCDMQCGNRVVQRGITCNLQVFWTPEGKGWGLRTLQDLPKGTFVCEYVGEILTNMELYERNMRSNGNKRHTYPVTLDADWGSESGLRDEEALCLDATTYGNVARFINHRCFDANLLEIPVEVETPDRHYYHLAFFTTRKVNALEELTWDYAIDFDDDDHPLSAFKCSCGSAYCRDKKRKGTRSKAFNT